MFQAGIVGGTGYTGVELLRLLLRHPEVEVAALTSRAEAGRRVDTLFPNLRGYSELCFTEPDPGRLAECDVVFFATPHNVAMHSVPELLTRDTRVIDLSADFRLRDAGLWSRWYNEEHACPELLSEAVYGLSEYNAEAIARGRLVACPGCYPTSIQLALLPLLAESAVETDNLIADAASGTSGAGRQAKVGGLFAEVAENFQAYAVDGHRHLPEIEQGLGQFGGEPVQITFVPHLLPAKRGILATLYARLRDPATPDEQIRQWYAARYDSAPFVELLPASEQAQTRTVNGSNLCRLALARPQGRNTLVITSAIDNLVKGAAGQAVQNMNLMLGLPETAGLDHIAVLP